MRARAGQANGNISGDGATLPGAPELGQCGSALAPAGETQADQTQTQQGEGRGFWHVDLGLRKPLLEADQACKVRLIDGPDQDVLGDKDLVLGCKSGVVEQQTIVAQHIVEHIAGHFLAGQVVAAGTRTHLLRYEDTQVIAAIRRPRQHPTGQCQ